MPPGRPIGTEVPLRAKQYVLVQVDDTEVSGLLLKWNRAGERALVTYEIGGRVATRWLLAAQLRPMPDTPRATEPVPD